MHPEDGVGPEPTAAPRVLVVMGVTGAGKSTIGQLLAKRLGWTFEEGDDLHPASNVAKMRAGIPLSEEDREPWLARVAEWIETRLSAGESGVVTCSALRRSYRDLLARHGGVTFVYLVVDGPTLEQRLAGRRGHYMSPALLGSQLGLLEEPSTDESAIRVDAGQQPDATVDRVLEELAGG